MNKLMELVTQICEDKILTDLDAGISNMGTHMFKEIRAIADSMEWIPVSERLPEKNQVVTATYKNKANHTIFITARYVERFSEEADPDTDCEVEYNEENDVFYNVEGWVESIENWGDYNFIYVVEGDVTHWKPLSPSDGDL